MIDDINENFDEETSSPTAEYSVKAQNFETVVDYTTKISNFEGPLDLLLFLVNRAEIEIKDIFVSQVTEQFLDYVNHAEDMDIEKESEYLAMAATLLEIKSKALLPQVEFDDDFGLEDYEDPKRSLIRQLEEFRIYKEASERLKEQETTDRFYKAPDESASEVRIIYNDFNLSGLVKAFTELLAKSDLEERVKNERKEIPKDSFTVANQINYIKSVMLERETCSFFELFTKHASKPEIITTFQALLELLKLQYLTVEQNETFDDITITLREDRSEEVGDLSEYN